MLSLLNNWLDLIGLTFKNKTYDSMINVSSYFLTKMSAFFQQGVRFFVRHAFFYVHFCVTGLYFSAICLCFLAMLWHYLAICSCFWAVCTQSIHKCLQLCATLDCVVFLYSSLSFAVCRNKTIS